MLLKSMLIQRGVRIFDRRSQKSEGFARCANLAGEHCQLSSAEAGVMRTLDSLRDAEQHWMIEVAEGILYLHMRALVTAIDDILKRFYADKLADHLSGRVLPVSTSVPTSMC